LDRGYPCFTFTRAHKGTHNNNNNNNNESDGGCMVWWETLRENSAAKSLGIAASASLGS
jgi:hypothetical protein